MGDFGIIRVPHRKSIVTDVVTGALQIAAQFDRIGATVQAMAERVLTINERLDFARATFEIRWAKVDTRPSFDPQKLLEVRRAADDHSTLWHVYNRCQEAAMAGGLHYQAANRRLVTTRKIRNIRELLASRHYSRNRDHVIMPRSHRQLATPREFSGISFTLFVPTVQQ
jgi:hypothetical protein